MVIKKHLVKGCKNKEYGYQRTEVCNVVLHYSELDLEGGAEMLVLHKVELVPFIECTLYIECPLDDRDVRELYENMLSEEFGCIDVQEGGLFSGN